jgi:hypothetical protein
MTVPTATLVFAAWAEAAEPDMRTEPEAGEALTACVLADDPETEIAPAADETLGACVDAPDPVTGLALARYLAVCNVMLQKFPAPALTVVSVTARVSVWLALFALYVSVVR